MTEKQLTNLKTFIDNHDAFIIAGHKEPDGDCISSSLALADLLKHYNKPTWLMNSGPFKRPEIKDFKKHFSTEFKQLTSNKSKTGLFIVDCSEIKRLGTIGQELVGLNTFIIDHHRTADAKPKTSIINPKAPATAYLIQQIFELNSVAISKKTAQTLFFGLCTDTGYFRYLDSTSADIFRAAARLIDAGADPRKTYDFITSGKPFNTRKLLGIMLDRAKQYFDGKLIITYETMEDTRKYAQEGRDSDALYSALLAIVGVEAVVFMRQETKESCTVGLRSRDTVDVSAIATSFGGGGHKNAAGLSTQDKLKTLKPKIIEKFSKVFS
ncbi:MAG TPA: bifunctional oligoribonuclease/PAP phosphatase NrnA [Treponemataceae bacterium]|nr:bifunctional oligoribonuclease/PAP phosphatase NrnA [Treponemataceae bacterium]